MTFSEEQVEWIVVEVIRRLGLLEGQRPTAVVGRSSTQLELTEKVVTLRTLERRLAGVTQVVVSTKAVVTPAVKDELKARRIELVSR